MLLVVLVIVLSMFQTAFSQQGLGPDQRQQRGHGNQVLGPDQRQQQPQEHQQQGQQPHNQGQHQQNHQGQHQLIHQGQPPSGCLIATAAFGSELTPQVQFLRNFRDVYIFSTVSGSDFMSVFNAWYYSFSPYVANYERDHPWFQHIVKAAIYPLFGILILSEKAYSSIPGEYGAVVAGLVASSLIGAVYFSPVAFAIKQLRRVKISYKLAIYIITAVIGFIVGSILSANHTVIMISTSLLVLVTIALSSLFFVRTAFEFANVINRKVHNHSLM